MATVGDGVTPYQSGGAGGKFRKRPIRRSAPATPYDRPPTALRNNNPSLFSKLMDPASRLIYAGADRLFGVFRKRLPPIPAPRPPETSEEPRNGIPETGPKNHTIVSEPVTNAGENLASISATTEISELENVLKQKTFTRSEVERLTALLHARTTEPDVVEEDRTKPPNTTSNLLRLEASTSGPLSKHVEERENFHTTISTPFINSRVFDEDVASPAELAKAYMGTRPAKVSPSTLRFNSQPPRQDSALLNNTTILPRTPVTSLSLVPKTAGTFKSYENGFTTPRSRGRSAIDNMARTPYYRGPSTSTLSQKGVASPSRISTQPAWEQEGPIGSSKMAVKRRSSAIDEIGSGGPMRRIRQKASMLSQKSSLSKPATEYGSSQKLKAVEENGETSKQILGYTSVPTESTKMASKIFEQLERMSPKVKPSGSRLVLGNLDKVDSPKNLSSFKDNQKSDARESTSQSKDKNEENLQRKFAVPLNVLSSINGNSPNNDPKLKQSAEPPQKKRAFHMSANEGSVEVDAENRSNGHVSIPLAENKKPVTSLFANKDASADVIQTPALPEANKVSGSPEFKKVDGPKSLFGSPSSSNTQAAQLSQSILKEDSVFPTFGRSTKSAEKVSPKTSPDAKPLGSTSNFNSGMKNDQVQFSASDNSNTQKPVNIFGKLEASSTASPTTGSGIFSFGGSTKNTTTTNGTPALSPPVFASSSPIPAFGTNATKLFGSSSVLVPSTTATAAASSASPTSAPAPAPAPVPIFSFGSKPTPVAQAPETSAPKEKEPSSIFGFSSPSTTNGNSQASLFNSTASTTQAVLFKFASSSASSFGLASAVATSDTKTGSNPTTTSLFGSGFSSTPSFGLSTAVASSETKSVSSISGPTTFQPPQSTTFTSSSPFSFGVSSPTVFGSSNNTNPSTGSSMFSFTATNSSPVFGNSTPVFGSSPDNNNDNDNMSMEDTMAEDSTHTPSPSIGQPSPTPGFMFGSATPFQFGGQTSQQLQPLQPPQQPSQNPFQASGCVDFNAGGSFSLGSGGGDKSGRRIVRVKSKNRRK